MITICTGCQARYRLDAAKVPARLIRVRCPGCATVFDLDGAQRMEPSTPLPVPTASLPAVESMSDEHKPASKTFVQEERPTLAEPFAPVEPAVPVKQDAPSSPDGHSLTLDPAIAIVNGSSKSPPALNMQHHGRRRRREKTEMLARALVSDILVYNQAARDKALAGGTLLESLGPEIKKSWELYKEKVGPEVATATTYFKDALNEILADGQQVF